MHVFVTGGSGLTGPAIVAELIGAGHTVVGLARSNEAADRLRRRHPHGLRRQLRQPRGPDWTGSDGDRDARSDPGRVGQAVCQHIRHPRHACWPGQHRAGRARSSSTAPEAPSAPVGGALPDLVEIAGGDPQRVLTISDFEAAQGLGVRDTFHQDPAMLSHRYEAFPEFAQLAADARFTVPIARTFPLEDWRAALEISLSSGQARGKLVLLP
jgi:NAD(P)-dependent dehydrogenase (short-subunit alcohol dehydrogenase family)